jgi:hypothetical protein
MCHRMSRAEDSPLRRAELSVFDSVIVPEQHEAFTKEVMTEEYKNIMKNFNPRF